MCVVLVMCYTYAMKIYQSYKTVKAGRIINLERVPAIVPHEFILTLDVDEKVKVSDEWITKHAPEPPLDFIGGYFVEYEDGYQSWSPEKAFEEGYKLI